ncbi:MAG: YchF/TatD family DNA exonuclease, partial [Nitrospirae bacterium]
MSSNEIFTDSHCHLDMKAFNKDRDDVIKRAKEAGVGYIINVGIDRRSNKKGIELSRSFKGMIYTTVGIHPHDAKKADEELFREMEELSELPEVVGIGETGLDYYHMNSPREEQIRVFEKHLELAISRDLPVVVHSRDAEDDTLEIISRNEYRDVRGVMHCFSGTIDMAKRVLDLGYYVSFSGIITFRDSGELRDVVKIIPDDRILIETDAPFLSPHPKRGRRNEPSHLIYTAEVVAKLRGISTSDVARITTNNAKILFNIGSKPESGEIAYKIRNSLYLNITNRCTNACTFCIRFQNDYVKGHYLRLNHEPSFEEIIEAIGEYSGDYSEVVFCGFGEPLLRLDIVKDVAKWLKKRGVKVRINTNGQANLIHSRNI